MGHMPGRLNAKMLFDGLLATDASSYFSFDELFALAELEMLAPFRPRGIFCISHLRKPPETGAGAAGLHGGVS